MAICPIVCNIGLGTAHSTSFSIVDLTRQLDTTCNNALLITDDDGLVDVDTPADGAWLFADKAQGPRAQIITSVDEALLHYTADSEVVKFARDVFANGNNGLQNFFYVGFWDKGNAETVTEALDAIQECFACWMVGVFVKRDLADADIVDTADMITAAAWGQTNEKMFVFGSHDTDTKNPINQTNITAQMALNGYSNAVVEYIEAQCRVVDDPLNPGTDITEDYYPYREAMLPLYMAKVKFLEALQPYGWMYKPQGGGGWISGNADAPIRVDNLNGSEKVAVTGVLPNGSLNPEQFGFANAYVRDNGIPGEWAGRTVTGEFIDAIHFRLFLIRLLRERIAQLFSNSRTVPYDDAVGRKLVFAEAQGVMNTLYNAGWLSRDVGFFDDAEYNITGPGGAGYGIRSASYDEQSATQKFSGVAPTLTVCYNYKGNVTHLPIALCSLSATKGV